MFLQVSHIADLTGLIKVISSVEIRGSMKMNFADVFLVSIVLIFFRLPFLKTIRLPFENLFI
jgi:hypothetical protein